VSEARKIELSQVHQLRVNVRSLLAETLCVFELLLFIKSILLWEAPIFSGCTFAFLLLLWWVNAFYVGLIFVCITTMVYLRFEYSPQTLRSDQILLKFDQVIVRELCQVKDHQRILLDEVEILRRISETLLGFIQSLSVDSLKNPKPGFIIFGISGALFGFCIMGVCSIGLMPILVLVTISIYMLICRFINPDHKYHYSQVFRFLSDGLTYLFVSDPQVDPYFKEYQLKGEMQLLDPQTCSWNTVYCLYNENTLYYWIPSELGSEPTKTIQVLPKVSQKLSDEDESILCIEDTQHLTYQFRGRNQQIVQDWTKTIYSVESLSKREFMQVTPESHKHLLSDNFSVTCFEIQVPLQTSYSTLLKSSPVLHGQVEIKIDKLQQWENFHFVLMNSFFYYFLPNNQDEACVGRISLSKVKLFQHIENANLIKLYDKPMSYFLRFENSVVSITMQRAIFFLMSYYQNPADLSETVPISESLSSDIRSPETKIRKRTAQTFSSPATPIESKLAVVGQRVPKNSLSNSEPQKWEPTKSRRGGRGPVQFSLSRSNSAQEQISTKRPNSLVQRSQLVHGHPALSLDANQIAEILSSGSSDDRKTIRLDLKIPLATLEKQPSISANLKHLSSAEQLNLDSPVESTFEDQMQESIPTLQKSQSLSLQVSVAQLVNPRYSGVLYKRGNSAWRERYFVFFENKLYYFHSNKDNSATGVIYLSGGSLEPMPNADRPFCFMIDDVVCSRHYYLAAHSESLFETWMSKLSELLPRRISESFDDTEEEFPQLLKFSNDEIEAIKISTSDLSNPTKAGYMVKRGEKVKTWRQRYFILKGTQLFYFKSEKGVAAGVIDLTQCRAPFFTAIPKRAFTFVIPNAKTGRNYVVSCSSQKEMEEWMQLIASNIPGYSEPDETSKFSPRASSTSKIDEEESHFHVNVYSPVPSLSGYVLKRKNQKFVSNWQKRFFVLRDGVLKSFVSHNVEESPKTVWPVSDIDFEIITNCPPDKHRFGITMAHLNGDVTFYTIEVASRNQLEYWLKSLQETKRQISALDVLSAPTFKEL